MFGRRLVTFCAFIVVVSLTLWLYFNSIGMKRPIYETSLPPSPETLSSATSGELFRGDVVRRFQGQLMFQSDNHRNNVAYGRSIHVPSPNLDAENRQVVADPKTCDNWSVVTTVMPPSPAVARQAHLGKDWCTVVVLDKKSPRHYHIDGLDREEETRVTYLDPEMQEAFLKTWNFTLLLSLPWNHFGRKNVGYLYAISQGARQIWDFDDDNILQNEQFQIPGYANGSIRVIDVQTHNFTTFNPYPMMGASHTHIWPRGLPLKHIKNKSSYLFDHSSFKEYRIDISSVAIVQSLADVDPDVDAIYRLTLPLPVTFKREIYSVAVPPSSYVPLNAQATLFLEPSFSTLFLPTTIHGRVSDIWRGYIAQRLLREANKRVLISSPLVEQHRNFHDYLADLQAEQDLYLKSEALINRLNSIVFEHDTIASQMEQIYVDLYERAFIEEQDILLAQGWISALQTLGKGVVSGKQISHSTKYSSLLPEVKEEKWPDLELFLTMPNSGYNEFQQQLLRSLLFFWPLHFLNMVIVLDDESRHGEMETKLTQDTSEFNQCTLRYNQPTQYYGGNGYDRQQLIMFWADNFTRAEYVGFVDTDTFFITPVALQDLFKDGKPNIIGLYGTGSPSWQKKSNATANILGQGEVLRCMSYFPVIIKTQHLKELRNYVKDLHGKWFNEYFEEMQRTESYSQFNIMCNYLWYHHRDEYSWHIQIYGHEVVNNTVPGQIESDFPQKIMWPKPRVAIHTSYHFIQPSKRILNQLMAAGYCYYNLARSHGDDYNLCHSDIVNMNVANPHMFSFEEHDWDYHPGLQDSFWERQSRLVKSPQHIWNNEELQRISVELSK